MNLVVHTKQRTTFAVKLPIYCEYESEQNKEKDIKVIGCDGVCDGAVCGLCQNRF